MQNSNSILFSFSLILITIISIPTIIQTVTNNIYSQNNSNLNFSITPSYYSIPTAAAEEDDDDTAEYNRNADKKHDDNDD